MNKYFGVLIKEIYYTFPKVFIFLGGKNLDSSKTVSTYYTINYKYLS